MNISSLLGLVKDTTFYQNLAAAIQAPQVDKSIALSGAARPALVAALWQGLGRPLLLMAPRPEDTRRWHDELQAWCGNGAHILLFPEPDVLPYEHLTPDAALLHQRLRVLFALSHGPSTPLIIASPYAVMQKTLSPESWTATCQTVAVGFHLNRERLLKHWLSLGYQREEVVEIPGTLAWRGGMVDIYPPHEDRPVRIEFFGDRVESLRTFDPTTQRSQTLIPSLIVVPAREIILPSNVAVELNLDSCYPEAQKKMESELRLLQEGQPFPGYEFYAPLFNNSTILDHLASDALLILDEPALIEAIAQELEAEAQALKQSEEEQGELPPHFPSPYVAWSALKAHFGQRLLLESWETDEPAVFHLLPGYGGRLKTFLHDVRGLTDAGRRVVIVSQQTRRLSELAEDQGIIAVPVTEVKEPPAAGSLLLIQGSLDEGWAIEEERGLSLFTDREVFGFVKERRRVRRRLGGRHAFTLPLSVGDYVVHVEHGIARFGGLTQMSLDGVQREYLVLEYAAGDRLYVPNDQIDRVSHYVGPSDYEPPLSRLGTQEWSRAKQRVRESVGRLAKELLALYATREVIPGFAFSADTVWQQELEASFPYLETPDQLEAIKAIKADMERPQPMDRLICGDVGYGKTEVALRATFKAVMDGAQVAVLVPTTVLAQQHYATFKERLGAFPLTVEMLSRFRSGKEQGAVVAGLRQGTVDICIGTHRLLQKDVVFKNLGLVIIDEEQRFGVEHKERLKQMRREVDVLTLSATPIPRTLHMSLVGVRDMSTMETPPEERLPIKTYMGEYQDKLVREAIIRELERGGQVFFVHNRVQSIAGVASRLEELAPEAEIAIAHGQMPEEQLERVMVDFAAGKKDVLVCTTIIESGLDMPNVNTLIVNEANRLGLSQLYQLRGRVGRSST
ncbi:MAG: transcription-repair coupling factor, partial [Chloroflexi bacterium]|nr:transcription-repair coupling factor [Chloroflexota bacterium]